MARVLVFGNASDPFVDVLATSEHEVVTSSLDPDLEDSGPIPDVFRGRPADVVVVDARHGEGLGPLQRARSLLAKSWGEQVRFPLLAVIDDANLQEGELVLLADDFLVASANPKELLVRVGMTLVRIRQLHDLDRLAFADVTLDLSSGIVYDLTGHTMAFTPKEYDLLQFLLSNRGRFFDRTRLLTQVWGNEFGGSDRTVDIHICRLRSKLPPEASSLLETRRGVGYGFNLP